MFQNRTCWIPKEQRVSVGTFADKHKQPFHISNQQGNADQNQRVHQRGQHEKGNRLTSMWTNWNFLNAGRDAKMIKPLGKAVWSSLNDWIRSYHTTQGFYPEAPTQQKWRPESLGKLRCTFYSDMSYNIQKVATTQMSTKFWIHKIWCTSMKKYYSTTRKN